MARLKPRPGAIARDAEGVLALARFILTCAIFVAVLSESNMQTDWRVASLLLYSALGLVAVWLSSLSRRTKIAMFLHVGDVVYASILLSFGDRGAPFFIYFVLYALLSAAGQWRWPVVLATGATLSAVYAVAVAMGVVSGDRLVMRSVFLFATTLLVVLGARAIDGFQARLFKLARWSGGRFAPSSNAMRDVLRHACETLEGDRAVVYCRESGAGDWERFEYAAASEELKVFAASAEEAGAELPDGPAVCIDPRLGIYLTYAGPSPGPPLPKQALLDGSAVAFETLRSDICEGRLFVGGIRNWRWDHLLLVELVARHVSTRLEGRILREHQARVAAENERERLASDLHDGLLQNLTAARLELKAASLNDPALAPRIESALELLRMEQARLRAFVETMRGEDGPDEMRLSDLLDRLAQVAQRWGIVAHVRADAFLITLPGRLANELSFLFAEAVANAAKHGRSGRVHIDIQHAEGRLCIEISNMVDDLSGLASAPRSMSDRVQRLGGWLVVRVEARRIFFTIEVPVH